MKVLFFMLILSASAFASQSGNDLISDCAAVEYPAKTSDDVIKTAKCIFYIEGVIDANEAWHLAVESENNHAFEASRICFPSGVTRGQTAKTVFKYLNDNPKDLHLDATFLVIRSLSESFPCHTPQK